MRARFRFARRKACTSAIAAAVRCITADAIRDDLATNMRYTVRWFDALTVMQEMGARVAIEAPPGQVLTDIAREHYPEMACACSEHASVRTARCDGAGGASNASSEPRFMQRLI